MASRTYQLCEEMTLFWLVKCTYTDGCTFSDMKEASNPDLSVRRQVANAIRDACINVGFFYGITSLQECTSLPLII